MSTQRRRKEAPAPPRARLKEAKSQAPSLSLDLKLGSLIHSMFEQVKDPQGVKPGFEAYLIDILSEDRPDLVAQLDQSPWPPELMAEIRRYHISSTYKDPKTGKRKLSELHWYPEPTETDSDTSSDSSDSDSSSDDGSDDGSDSGSDSDVEDEDDEESMDGVAKDGTEDSVGESSEDAEHAGAGPWADSFDKVVNDIMREPETAKFVQEQLQEEPTDTPEVGKSPLTYEERLKKARSRLRAELRRQAEKRGRRRVYGSGTYYAKNRSMKFLKKLFPKFKKQWIGLTDIYNREEKIRGPNGKRLTGDQPYAYNKTKALHFVYNERLVRHLKPDIIICFGKHVKNWFLHFFGHPDENDVVLIDGRKVEVFFVPHPEHLGWHATKEQLKAAEETLRRMKEKGVDYDADFFKELIEQRRSNRERKGKGPAKREKKRTSSTKKRTEIVDDCSLPTPEEINAAKLQLTKRKAEMDEFFKGEAGKDYCAMLGYSLHDRMDGQGEDTKDYLKGLINPNSGRAKDTSHSARAKRVYDLTTPSGLRARMRRSLVGRVTAAKKAASHMHPKVPTGSENGINEFQKTNDGSNVKAHAEAFRGRKEYHCVLWKCGEIRATLNDIKKHMDNDHPEEYSFSLWGEFNITEQVFDGSSKLCPSPGCGHSLKEHDYTRKGKLNRHIGENHPRLKQDIHTAFLAGDWELATTLLKPRQIPPPPPESRRFFPKPHRNETQEGIVKLDQPATPGNLASNKGNPKREGSTIVRAGIMSLGDRLEDEW